jgi:hypothetical protein
MMSTSARRGIAAAGVFFLALATLGLQSRALERRARFSAEEDVLYLPRASALRVLSLGHTELAADLVFLRALVYFGGQLATTRRFLWLDNYLDTIVALDPSWKTPYRWAGVATMYNGRAITNESVRASSHFLEMGVRQFPSDWELPFMLGCNYTFELHSDDPAARSAWRQQGAEWIRHAAIVGGAPPWVPLLAATILRREGHEEAAVRHLEEVYRTTQDEQTRAEVKNRLVGLKAKVDFAREERERAAFEGEWKRTVPYAPPDFFAVVGARRSPRLDPGELARDPVLDSAVEPEDATER